MKARKAISPVIAIIIIVAVTIAIAVAVAGWLMGLWGGYAKGGPNLQITYAVVFTNGTIVIDVANKGSGPSTIDRVVVDGEPVAWASISAKAIQGNPETAGDSVTLDPGESVEMKINSGNTYPSGQPVTVEVVDSVNGARASTTVPATP